jgi:hypothetical protein
MTRLQAIAVITLFVCLSPSGYSQLVITPTFDSTITNNPNRAQIEATINQAINFYQTNFSDNVSVSITFKVDETISLGQSSTFVNQISYTNFRNAMLSHATTANDTLALNNLPNQSGNPANGNSNMLLSLPNLRTLGFTRNNPPPGQTDGTISLKMSLMNLDHTVVTDSAKFDLFAVASHEINEVLGLGSALNSGSGSGIPARPMDMFRYDQTGARSFTRSASAQSFFSLDSTTHIVQFNQNSNADFGDWQGVDGPRVQNAFATAGVILNNGVPELTALDVIGYTPVPEPVAVLGFVAMCLAVNYRRRLSRTPSG